MSMIWAGVVALVVGLGQAAVPAGDGAMSSYHDAALGLTYRYPVAMKAQPDIAAALSKRLTHGVGDADDAEAAKCISIPLAAVRERGEATEDEFGMIVMLRIDHACLGEPGSKERLGEAAQLLMRILRQFGVPLTEDAMAYKLDGHEASFVKGAAQAKMLGEGKMLHAASVCSLVGTNTVCWLILDSNHKAMPGLVGNPVVFDGRTGVALVPGDLVTKW